MLYRLHRGKYLNDLKFSLCFQWLMTLTLKKNQDGNTLYVLKLERKQSPLKASQHKDTQVTKVLSVKHANTHFHTCTHTERRQHVFQGALGQSSYTVGCTLMKGG